MNLLFTATSYVPAVGGAQIHLHEIAKRLLHDHEVDVATFWRTNRSDWLLGTTVLGPRNPDAYKVDGVSVHRLGFTPLEKARLLLPTALYMPTLGMMAPAIALLIVPKLEKLAANADLVHNIRIGREPLSLASLQLAQRKDIPFVITPLHHPRWMNSRYAVFHRIFREADQVIALTQAEKSMLIRLGVRDEAISVTGIGPVLSHDYDANEFLKKNEIETPFVLFLGQHYHYKGYSHLLAAAKRVWKEVPQTEFVFIGPSVGNSETEFRAVDRRIHRLGTVSLEDKTSALAACDILCVPSTQESFGGVYVEAWSFSKPVVGCRIPAVSELIEDTVDGFLVAQTAEDIADKLLALLQNPKQASELGAAGRTKVESRYQWSILLERTLDAYRRAFS